VAASHVPPGIRVSPGRFQIVTFDAPEASEEILVARLWVLGCAGSWSRPGGPGRTRIEACFDGPTPARSELAELGAFAGVDFLGVAAAAERDWLAEWRAEVGPIELGARFLVDPREPGEADEPVDSGGRIVLRLPARTAFGVGSHESTRLAVELLEAVPVAGREVLDVGTGTGILAFAALALGARSAVALDLDPAAALLLPAAMTLNRRRFAAYVGGIDALASAARFELALVNVVPAEIESDLERLAAAVVPGGGAIFSGILIEQGAAALERLARAGFVERERRTAGEWIAFATERRQRP
jgi:ribosomal protein L11 methyltransferase